MTKAELDKLENIGKLVEIKVIESIGGYEKGILEEVANMVKEDVDTVGLAYIYYLALPQ